MGLKETFKKQGGMKLIKQYWKGGALFTAIVEFLILGKDNKALEILRLASQYKIKRKLEKKYKKHIKSFLINYKDDMPHNNSNKVWVCWFQGMSNAPELVKKCYESLKNNLVGCDIVLITRENMKDYVEFPDFIIDKWKCGQITNTHMTDLLRLELLIRYGGMWVDATVLCTSKRKDIPDYFFDSDLFLYQMFKPGKDGQAQPVSSWLISAKSNNKILLMTKFLCYEYWKINTEMVDYFLFHNFLVISLENNKEEWDKIIPRDNSAPHYLLLRLFDKYNEKMFGAIIQQTPFHKLTYKYDKQLENIENTFFAKIINDDIERITVN